MRDDCLEEQNDCLVYLSSYCLSNEGYYMPLIYITGIPGSGKTTVRGELRRRGYQAFGTDEDQLAFYYDNQTGEPLKQSAPAAIRTPEWRLLHTWKVARAEVEKLQKKAKDGPVFLCGVVANDVTELWDLFDVVIALTIDEETLCYRITTRTNDDFGKPPHEFELLLNWQKTAREDYQQLGAIIVDAIQPVEAVVDDILARVKVR
jgi:dephospho-CoA kinase